MVVAATNLPLPLSRGENGCFRKNEVAFGLVDFQGVSFFSDHCVAEKKISLREHRLDSAEKTGGRVHGSCCHESSIATVERGERVL